MTSNISNTAGSFESSGSDPDFEVSNFLVFDQNNDEDLTSIVSSYFRSAGVDGSSSGGGGSGQQTTVVNEIGAAVASSQYDLGGSSSGANPNPVEQKKAKPHVAFRTESEVDVLEDGYKWRKYGKKKVKDNINPRNYYRCSVNGCPVKKRVERDRDDMRYVITSYHGIHNHIRP